MLGTPQIQMDDSIDDHSELLNLPWSVAGHTINTGVDFDNNNILNCADVSLNTISPNQGPAITVQLNAMAGNDFIVGNNNALIVEGDNDRVGIGTNAPDVALHTLGGVKLAADATADVTLFEDIDVADGVDGRKLIVHRKAAEGDQTVSMYVDDAKNPTFEGGAGGDFFFNSAQRIAFNSGYGVVGLGQTGQGGMSLHFSTPDARIVWGSSTTMGRNIVLAWEGVRSQAFDHPSSTDPHLYIQSLIGGDVTNNQWGSFHHNQEDFVITTGANTGAGSAPTTDNNGIIFSPRGTEQFRVGSTLNETVLPIRGTTSLWWEILHFDVAAFNPGGSGATHIDPDSNTLGGFRLDAATETLVFHGHAHESWDGASDLILEVFFEVNIDNTGGNVGDTVDLRTQFFYKGADETANKTQTVEVSTVVGQSARYKLFSTEFVIDYDLASNVVNSGDIISMIANLETDTSEVDNAVITHAELRFKTAKIHEEV